MMLSAILVPVTATIDIIVWLARLVRTMIVLSSSTVTCDGCGTETELVGRWRCETGCVYDGHAWADCPFCGEHQNALACPCGLTHENPLAPIRDAR